MLKNSYITIDYFREMKQKAYGKSETFDEFVERIAEKYFPGRGSEWRMRYAFSLHFYGLCVAACENCRGICPHHGHRYQLRIKRGSSVPIPWASLDICPKFKESIDRQGRRHKVIDIVESTSEPEEFSIPLELFEEQFFEEPQTMMAGMWPIQTKKTKQQDLFEMDGSSDEPGK